MTADCPLASTGDFWVAFWTAALTLVTTCLVGVGFVQLRALREDAILGRTLDQCNRYQIDPILDKCLRRLARGWNTKSIQTNPESFRPDIVTLLNYLDSLAFGCENGIYLEDFVRVHMKPIYEFHYDQYLGPDRIPVAGIDLDDYLHIKRCREKWVQQRMWHRRSV